MKAERNFHIVLTGATRGLGRAMVDGFAASGHTVIGCGRNAGQIASLGQAYAHPYDFQVVDVANASAVARWAQSVLGRHGPPDLLINNAAITVAPTPLWEISEGDFSRVIDVNIKGTAHVIRAFVPAMVMVKRGIVVNFSSGWGRSTDAGVAPYCANKWAIEGLTQAMSQELPKGMAAVAINPGVIDTDMLRQCFGASAENYPSPEEWARSALPFILGLGPKDNGQALSVPGAKMD